MKRICFIIVLLLLLLNPLNIFAKENVEIKSVELIDKSANVIETKEASFSGISLLFGLKMEDVDDYAKYKVVVKNNSDTKYRMNTTLEEKEYFKYIFDYENSETILDTNEEKVIFVTVKYAKEVSAIKIALDGVYKENNSISINFDNNEFVANPKTFMDYVYIVIIFTIIISLIVSLILFKKSRKYIMLLLFSIAYIIPFYVYAIRELKIIVNGEVEINRLDTFSVDNGNGIVQYEFVRGMTIMEFEKAYNNVTALQYIHKQGCYGYYFYDQCLIENDYNYSECPEEYHGLSNNPENYNSVILNTEKGYYKYYHCCLSGDMEVEVLDAKTKKRRRKKLKDIDYDDLMLVWDFDNACFTWAKPFWIMETEKAPCYYILRFSDGTELEVIGDHNIYSCDDNKFVSAIEAPMEMKTMNSNGDIITLISREKIEREINAYNVITNYHINMFANGILTSWNINNLYDIKDMKFIKEERELIELKDIGDIPVEYYDTLRLKEMPKLLKETKEETYKYLYNKVSYLIKKKKI